MRLLSRQFAVTKLELEADKAAFLAQKLGTSSPPDSITMTPASSITAQIEGIPLETAAAEAVENAPLGDETGVERMPVYNAVSSDEVLQKLFPSEKQSSAARFNFNPALLLARDRWSQAWTSFRTAAAEQESLPVAELEAVPAAVTVASSLSQNLMSMEVEKPLKWNKTKPKVGIKK